jgi:hypothetical protein
MSGRDSDMHLRRIPDTAGATASGAGRPEALARGN